MPITRMLLKVEDIEMILNKARGSATIGVDLGDKYSVCCVLDAKGAVLSEGRIRSTPESFAELFGNVPSCRIAIEVGAHSRWVDQLLCSAGHRVIVANPRNLPMITQSIRKSDRVDAEMLARLARVDEQLLSPVKHRAAALYPDIAKLRARDLLVRTRTRLVNAVLGITKAAGVRMRRFSTESFARQALPLMPEELRGALLPLLETVAHLSEQIDVFDREFQALCRKQYPETSQLLQVKGVGPITALHFILTVGDVRRFTKSRDIGPYLGLTPKRDQSGDTDRALGISKAGNRQLRVLLVQCAHFVLGRFGEDSNLRRWGLKIAERGGKNAKKRAVTAVARKLAVLLHHLWANGDVYQPLHGMEPAIASA